MKYSASKENYLKAIFHLQQQSASVSTNALAHALQTKAASVTSMLKKLSTQKLLQYERYKGVSLTAEGRKVAVFIIRKHRLWEYFMVQKLGLGWEEVHDIAEELEHVTSKKLIDSLEAYLDFPKADPHGDPIPDGQGRMPPSKQLSLAAVAINTTCTISHIGNQSAEMMELMQHKSITIGTTLEVKKKFSFDNSVEVKLHQHPPFTISEQLAQNLFVQHFDTGAKETKSNTGKKQEKKIKKL